MNNNKELGSNFEKEFCIMLKKNGYWAHFIEPNKSGGQPFDIVAGKNDIIYAFDCKTSSKDRFDLSRIEDNQELAFTTFELCGNNHSFIVVKYNNKIYYLPAIKMIDLKKKGIKSVRLEDGYNSFK